MESVPDPIFPDIAPFDYVIDLLSQIGPTEVSWTELKAWQDLTGISLDYWELNTIRNLSILFSNKFQEYNNTNISSPYRDIDLPSVDQKAIQSLLRNDQRFNK